MAWFGSQDTSGLESSTIESTIMGVFAAPESWGTITKISAFLAATLAAKNAKCALYKDSDNSLIGSSSQVLIPIQAHTWVEFNCSIPIEAGVAYQIVVWGATGSGNLILRRQDGEYIHKYKSIAFDGWPNPLSGFGLITKIHAIYATYTPSDPPYPVGRLKKDVIHGFNCFINAYVLAKLGGFVPLKLPDGTTF